MRRISPDLPPASAILSPLDPLQGLYIKIIEGIKILSRMFTFCAGQFKSGPYSSFDSRL